MIAQNLACLLDNLLTRFSARRARVPPHSGLPTRSVATSLGNVQVYDSFAAIKNTAGDANDMRKPCVILVPDGPNVIAHYEALIALLLPKLRVVCFDMPGFGQSLPHPAYHHSLDQGAHAVLGVMDALGIERATLAFSCANGFYALRAAQLAAHRVAQLILSQTPSLPAMHAWVERVIPWPLKVPVLGQLAAWLFRRKAALGWYSMALPRNADARPMQDTARYALACGGCFCLAGVVQGLTRALPTALHGTSTPCTLVWGGLDRSHRQTNPLSLREVAPQVGIVQFEDCGHFPDIEQPERFADLVIRLVL